MKRAEAWLRGTQGCSVVLCELVTAAGETPDAIGWKTGASTLIECKISRADFFRDKDKLHHRAGVGMGTYRYYMVPAGLIKREEVPPMWGLLEVGPRAVKKTKSATTRSKEPPDVIAFRQQREIVMLVSALRRANEKAVKTAKKPIKK